MPCELSSLLRTLVRIRKRKKKQKTSFSCSCVSTGWLKEKKKPIWPHTLSCLIRVDRSGHSSLYVTMWSAVMFLCRGTAASFHSFCCFVHVWCWILWSCAATWSAGSYPSVLSNREPSCAWFLIRHSHLFFTPLSFFFAPLLRRLHPPGGRGGGGSLRKMLGSERGVVEEWLSEFKVRVSRSLTLSLSHSLSLSSLTHDMSLWRSSLTSSFYTQKDDTQCHNCGEGFLFYFIFLQHYE